MNCFQDFVTAAASMSTLKVTTNPVDGHVMFARIDASIFLRKRIFAPRKVPVQNDVIAKNAATRTAALNRRGRERVVEGMGERCGS
jgi:hypothetical protein